jgi:hypothetical protein
VLLPVKGGRADPARTTNRLICALLILTTVAAVISSLERPDGFFKKARSLMLIESVLEAAIDAGAIGEVRYVAVPR